MTTISKHSRKSRKQSYRKNRHTNLKKITLAELKDPTIDWVDEKWDPYYMFWINGCLCCRDYPEPPFGSTLRLRDYHNVYIDIDTLALVRLFDNNKGAVLYIDANDVWWVRLPNRKKLMLMSDYKYLDFPYPHRFISHAFLSITSDKQYIIWKRRLSWTITRMFDCFNWSSICNTILEVWNESDEWAPYSDEDWGWWNEPEGIDRINRIMKTFF